MPSSVLGINLVASSHQTSEIPTFYQGVRSFSESTLGCLAHGQCALPGMSTNQTVGSEDSAFVVIGLILFLLLVSAVFGFFRKLVPAVEEVQESIPSIIEENKPSKPKKKVEPAFRPQKATAEAVPTAKSGKRTSDFKALVADSDVIVTQLDLARVYVDMGSSREARKILNAVLKAGNKDQQLTAKKLLKKVEEAVTVS